MVEALSGWAAAIATLAAVVVSLKLARGDAPKLQVGARIQLFMPGPIKKIRVEISNSGRRAVKLQEFYFRIGKLVCELSPLLAITNESISMRLAEGDSISVDMDIDHALDYLEKIFGFDKVLLKKPGSQIYIGVLGVASKGESKVDRGLRDEMAKLVVLRATPI